MLYEVILVDELGNKIDVKLVKTNKSKGEMIRCLYGEFKYFSDGFSYFLKDGNHVDVYRQEYISI